VPAEIKTLTAEESYNHKDLQKIFGDLTNAEYAKKVEPANLLPKQLGNSYTASMYTGLLSLLTTKKNDLV
jgi:hydroxymethylglutaryl-CoA synthase